MPEPENRRRPLSMVGQSSSNLEKTLNSNTKRHHKQKRHSDPSQVAALLLTNGLTRISSVFHHVEVRRRHDAGGLLAFRISADLSYPQCPSASTCSSSEHSPFMHRVYPLSSLSKSTRIDICKFSFLVLPKVPPRLFCTELRMPTFARVYTRAIYVDMWISRTVNPC